MILSEAEVLRVVRWITRCDWEGYIVDDDWPLIERVASTAGLTPADVAPTEASQRKSDGR